MSFSPDGRRLVAGGQTGTPAKLKVWDAGEPTPDSPEADLEAWRAKVLAWYARGADAFEAHGQWDSALTRRSDQIDVSPLDPARWHARGWTYLRAKEWDKAIADYSRALELKPTEATTWGSRAWCRERQRQWEPAHDDYAKGIELEPLYWEGWIGRPRCHVQLGQWERAVADFAETVRLQPNGPLELHRHQLALAYLAVGDEPGLRRVCRDALDRFGKTTNNRVASRVLYTCVLLPDVITDLPRLVALGKLAATEFKGHERILGAALYRAGRYAEALAAFDESRANGYRQWAWDLCFVAMCHAKLNSPDTARDCLSQADCWIEEADRLDRERANPDPNTWAMWTERAEVGHLHREAKALLDGMSK